MLQDFQTRLKDALLSDQPLEDGRFNIHRNNIFFGLTSCLREVYPVVHRLLGNDFFKQTAHHFIKKNPPASAHLLIFGAKFPAFVQNSAPSLAYLHDVAQLEWAYHTAWHARNATLLSPEDLQNEQNLPDLKLTLHPSSIFIDSPFPIAKIWEINRQEKADNINLSRGGGEFLIIRPKLEVEVRTLSPSLATFLKTLHAGQTIGHAFEEALNTKKDFDLKTAFQTLIKQGTFISGMLS